MSAPSPYLPRRPGDHLSAPDWNEVQVLALDELAGHAHAPGSLPAEALSPVAALSLAAVSVQTLALRGESVEDRARRLGVAPLLEAALESRLPRRGDAVAGDLRVLGDLRVKGDLRVEGELIVGGVPYRGRPRKGMERAAVGAGPLVVDDAGAWRERLAAAAWDPTGNPTRLRFELDTPTVVLFVAQLTGTSRARAHLRVGSGEAAGERRASWTLGEPAHEGRATTTRQQPVALPAGAHHARVELEGAAAEARLLAVLFPGEAS